MRVTVTFDKHGNIRHIRYSELKFLEALGPARHDRVSHVIPANRLLRWLFRRLRSMCTDDSPLAEFTRRWPCHWQADLALCGGPVLGPFRRRSEALAAEVAWIETNILGGGHCCLHREQETEVQLYSTDHGS
jgi:hypothetical protein